MYDARVVPVRLRGRQGGHQGNHQGCLDLESRHFIRPLGGTNDTKFNLQDSNFLGWGKALQISHGSTVDRTSNTIAWADPNVLGSRWTVQADLCGFQRRLAAHGGGRRIPSTPSILPGARKSRPSVSTAPCRATTWETSSINSTTTTISYELSGGLSSGLIDGWTKRLDVRHALRPQFIPARARDGSLPARMLPPDRTLSYPFVGFDILQDEYKKVGDENQIGRAEDLYFGTEVIGESDMRAACSARTAMPSCSRSRRCTASNLPHEQQLFLTGDFSVAHGGGRVRAI